MTKLQRARMSLERIAAERINSPQVQKLFADVRAFDAKARALRQRIAARGDA